eukprot:COSAG01_NODE_2539_length_7485_cov_49.290650_5_plen_99_part_00
MCVTLHKYGWCWQLQNDDFIHRRQTRQSRLAQKVVDNLGGGAKSSRFLGPCTEKIELGILIEEVSPRSTNIQSERVAFYLTLSARFFVYKGEKIDYFP